MRCRVFAVHRGPTSRARPAGYRHQRRWPSVSMCISRRMSGETRIATLLKISPRSSPSIATETISPWETRRISASKRRHMDMPLRDDNPGRQLSSAKGRLEADAGVPLQVAGLFSAARQSPAFSHRYAKFPRLTERSGPSRRTF